MLANEWNRTAHIGYLCGKITVLSCHRCLIKTSVEKTFKYKLKLWPPDVSKKGNFFIPTIAYDL